MEQDTIFVDIFFLVADIMLADGFAVAGIQAPGLEHLHQTQTDGCLAAIFECCTDIERLHN